MQTRTFQSAAAQVEPPQISLPEVAVGKIDIAELDVSQVEAAKVATAKVARLASAGAPIEFLAATFAEQQVQGVGRSAWFSYGHGLSRRRIGGNL